MFSKHIRFFPKNKNTGNNIILHRGSRVQNKSLGNSKRFCFHILKSKQVKSTPRYNVSAKLRDTQGYQIVISSVFSGYLTEISGYLFWAEEKFPVIFWKFLDILKKCGSKTHKIHCETVL